MSNQINDGGCAFPCSGTEGVNPESLGMSLRDYFAAAALTGIKSNQRLCEICSQVPYMTTQEAIAEMAFKDADAMLAERQKSQ